MHSLLPASHELTAGPSNNPDECTPHFPLSFLYDPVFIMMTHNQTCHWPGQPLAVRIYTAVRMKCCTLQVDTSYEMAFWRRMEIGWTDRSCEMWSIAESQGADEHPTDDKTQQCTWVGLVLHSNRLVRHVIEGKIKDGRPRRRRKQLLDDLK